MRCIVKILSLVAMISFLGCGSATEAPTASSQAGHEEHDEDGHDDEHGDGDEHGHDQGGHPEEGPHHGSLIELGNEEYHAELVHDDASGTVTIYLLDSSAKLSVPIDATSVFVNLSHDGNAEQFELVASPQSADLSGKSSRFVSTDAELAEDLDHEGAEAKLVVTIGGKQYRGTIEHDHEHDEDHDHDH